MNLYHLRYFTVPAETQHFGKATDILCIAQPSLRHAISPLEAELGIRLFERKSRSSALTNEGTQFLGYVEKSSEITVYTFLPATVLLFKMPVLFQNIRCRNHN